MAKGTNALYTVSLSVFGLGALLLVYAGFEGWEEINFRRKAVTTNAEVSEVIDCGGVHNNPESRQGFRYRFKAESGQIFDGFACGVGAGVGDIASISYLPEDPARKNRLATTKKNDFFYFMWAGILMALGGLFMTQKTKARATTSDMLIERGKTADAEVTIVMRYQGEIHYKFQDDKGQPFTGTTYDLFQFEEEMDFRKGAHIVIRYDPRNPKVNRWFPKHDTKIVYPEKEK